MPSSSEKFPHASVVWAKMDGFPWWPGHVVRRDEVRLDAGEPEPRIGRGFILVEFFNDNNRFASLHVRHIRYLKSSQFEEFRRFKGEYATEMRVAVKEAEDYLAATPNANGHPLKHPSRSVSPTAPAVNPPSDHSEPTKLQSPGDLLIVRDAPSEKEASRANVKKRKKEPVPIPSAPSSEKPRKKKRREKPPLDSQDDLSSSVPSVRPTKKKKKDREQAKRSSDSLLSPQRDEKPKLSDTKKRPKAKKEPRDYVERQPVPDLHQPSQEERPAKRRKEHADVKLVEVPKPTRKRERSLAPVQKGPEQPPVPTPAPATPKNPEPVDLSDGYNSLTKEEVIRLLLKRNDDVRAMRVEIWKYRFQDMDHRNIIKSSALLLDKCTKPFATVEKFIDFASDATRPKSDDDAVTRRSLEHDAVQAVLELREVYFDVSSLKSTKLGSQLFKLTKSCRDLSSLLCTVLRELLVQWVDISSVAATLEDDESVSKGPESPANIAKTPEAEKPAPSDSAVPIVDLTPTPVTTDSPGAKKVRPQKKSEEVEEVEIVVGTPKDAEKPKSSASRDSGGTSKDSEKHKGSGNHAKRLSPVKFIQIVIVSLKELVEIIPGLDVDGGQLEEIAGRWEKAMVPSWEDDADGYYSVSLKLLKYMRKANKYYKHPHDDVDRSAHGPTMNALVTGLRNPEESAHFISLFLSQTKAT